MEMDKAASEAIAEAMKALAHNVRLALLLTLSGGERSVSEIERATGFAQPGLSQQLKVLRQADLVLTRRAAKQVFYRLNPDRIAEAREFLDRLIGSSAVSGRAASAPARQGGGGAAAFVRMRR